VSDRLRQQRAGDRERISVLIDHDHLSRIIRIAEEHKTSSGTKPRYGPVIRAVVSLGLPVLEREIAAERAEQRAKTFLSEFQSGERLFANEVLTEAPLQDTDLSDRESPMDLSFAKLCDANLSGTNLSYADLSGTDFQGADLRRASLRGTKLEMANLEGADMRYCDVYDAVYDSETRWPDGFNYRDAGAITKYERQDKEAEGWPRINERESTVGGRIEGDDDDPILLPPPQNTGGT